MTQVDSVDINHFTSILKQKFMLNTYVYLSIVLFLFSLYFYFVGQLVVHSYFSFLFLSLFAMLYFSAKKGLFSFVTLVHLQNVILMLVMSSAFLASGGLRAPVIFWVPVVMYSTMSLVGRRAMLIWLVVGVVIISAFLLLELNGFQFTNIHNEANRHILHYAHFILLSFFTFSICLLNERTNQEHSKIQINLIERMYHQNRLANLGEIVAGVGHEVNNPLAISHGYMAKLKSLLKKENITTPEVLDAIETIEASNYRIIDIIKSLRSFSRKDSDRNGVTNIKEMIEEIAHLVEVEYANENIKFTYPKETPHFNVRGNHSQIQQVLFNLLSNARDAIEKKIEKEIEIKLDESTPGRLNIIVKDNGDGIPENIKDKVLDPFFTTKPVNKGTGLGLSISHNLIKAFGGSISIESEVGLGTAVQVSFDKA